VNRSQAASEVRRPSNEIEWVEAIRAGDGSAFESVFHAYHAPLCALAYRYLGARDLAEEMVQEVFLGIWERRETWEVRSSVKGYLCTAVRNAALSYLRHERVVQRSERDIRNWQAPSPERPDLQALEEETVAAVQQAVSRLPDRCRLVFTLHREQGLTYAEVAQVLGISPRTVEVQIGRALKSLRKGLAGLQP
jgi:RNA polymerase sigma-70 factor (family 1)